jgi:hypothetical protein
MPERTCVDRCGDTSYVPFILGLTVVGLFFYKNREPSLLWFSVPVIFIFVWFLSWIIHRNVQETINGPSCPCRFF